MTILVVGPQGRLRKAIADELLAAHELRLWSVDEASVDGASSVTGDLRDPNAARRAVRGVDAIVHTGEPFVELPDDPILCEHELLDFATRGTHVLFKAGIEAGVKRFVYGSTLKVFETYPDDVFISELWQPKPTPDPFVLMRYLGELAAREFARDHLVAVTALRLGKLVLEDEVADQTPDLMWLDVRDAARAFHLALKRDARTEVNFRNRWALYHVCADIPNGKYLVNSNRWHQLAGFAPQHNFEAHWAGGAA